MEKDTHPLFGSSTWWNIVDGFPWTYRKGKVEQVEFMGRIHPKTLEQTVPLLAEVSLKDGLVIKYGDDRFGHLIAISPRQLSQSEKATLADLLLALEIQRDKRRK